MILIESKIKQVLTISWEQEQLVCWPLLSLVFPLYFVIATISTQLSWWVLSVLLSWTCSVHPEDHGHPSITSFYYVLFSVVRPSSISFYVKFSFYSLKIYLILKKSDVTTFCFFFVLAIDCLTPHWFVQSVKTALAQFMALALALVWLVPLP